MTNINKENRLAIGIVCTEDGKCQYYYGEYNKVENILNSLNEFDFKHIKEFKGSDFLLKYEMTRVQNSSEYISVQCVNDVRYATGVICSNDKHSVYYGESTVIKPFMIARTEEQSFCSYETEKEMFEKLELYKSEYPNSEIIHIENYQATIYSVKLNKK